MWQFVICEDNHLLLEQIRGYIEEYLEIHKIGQIKLSTEDPNEVLDLLGQDDPIFKHVYFLDIELNAEIDGIELAKRIRKEDQHCEIVFITDHDQYMIRNFHYRLKALDYISKTVNIRERLHGCLDDVRKNMVHDNAEQWLEIDAGSSSYRNQYKNVIAFEGSRKHKVTVVEIEAEHDISASLSGTEQMLDYPFTRIHRSFIINLLHLKRHFREGQALYVEMSNKKVYPVSRNFSKEITHRDRYNS